MTPTLLAIGGGVALLVIAAFGGGIEVKEIKIPKLENGGRVICAIVGIALMIIGIYLNGPIHPFVLQDQASSAQASGPATGAASGPATGTAPGLGSGPTSGAVSGATSASGPTSGSASGSVSDNASGPASGTVPSPASCPTLTENSAPSTPSSPISDNSLPLPTVKDGASKNSESASSLHDIQIGPITIEESSQNSSTRIVTSDKAAYKIKISLDGKKISQRIDVFIDDTFVGTMTTNMAYPSYLLSLSVPEGGKHKYRLIGEEQDGPNILLLKGVGTVTISNNDFLTICSKDRTSNSASVYLAH